MPNMDPKKCPMPSQEPNVRNKNFKEVALGYTEEMAANEAKRCLQCKNHPCRSGCPVEIDIPGFIKHVAEGDFEAAYNVIAQSSALPAVCGRVCPQEHQCEGKCVRGIKGEAVGIGRLERFVADWYRNNVHTKPTAPAPNGHKVAVIGAGPSGLTVAGDLAKLGYKVTVYEALHVAGGVLMYGIPEFRLPKDIVQHEVEGLKELGVDIEYEQKGNLRLGKTEEHLERLRKLTASCNKAGLDMVMLDSKQAHELNPYMSDEVTGAAWCPTDGHANPLKVTLGYYKRAREMGAHFITGEEVVTRMSTGRSRMRVIYHIENAGRERLASLKKDYETVQQGIHNILDS